jgi:hypothetical protein
LFIADSFCWTDDFAARVSKSSISYIHCEGDISLNQLSLILTAPCLVSLNASVLDHPQSDEDYHAVETALKANRHLSHLTLSFPSTAVLDHLFANFPPSLTELVLRAFGLYGDLALTHLIPILQDRAGYLTSLELHDYGTRPAGIPLELVAAICAAPLRKLAINSFNIVHHFFVHSQHFESGS